MRPLLLEAIDTFHRESAEKVEARVDAIIEAAEDELLFWSIDPADPDGAHLEEGNGRPGSGHARQDEILARLRAYIDSARPDIDANRRADHAEDYTTSARPWSASFVSHLHREAGWSEAEGFAFHNGHSKYIRQALCNRLNRDYSKPFWLYRADEAEIEEGDLVGVPRGGFAADFDFDLSFFQMSGVDGDVPRIVWQAGEWRLGRGEFTSHTDVVVRFEDRESDDPVEAAFTLKNALAVGGNTSHIGGPNAHTCGLKRFAMRNGRLLPDPDVFVIKLLRERHFDDWRDLSRAKLGVEGTEEEVAALLDPLARNSLLDVFGTQDDDGPRVLPSDLVRLFDRHRDLILPDEGDTPVTEIDFGVPVRPMMQIIPPDVA